MERYVFPEGTRAALEALRQPFAVYQAVDGKVVTLLLSDGFCSLLGYTDRNRAVWDMDHDMYRDTHPDDLERVTAAALRFSAGGDGEEYDVVYRTKAGMDSGYLVLHAHGVHVRTETGARISQVWYTNEGTYVEGDESAAGGMNRILNSALHEESILRATQYDDLTGLPNLAWFFKLCEIGKARVFSEGKQGVLLYIDLDGMKYFNHKYGFAEGDKLLKAFAALLVSLFGRDRSCHIGADRFAVSTKEDGLESRLNHLVREAAMINGGNTLPVRIGVYSTSMEDVPVSSAYDRAKVACDSVRKADAVRFRYYTRSLSDAERRKRYIQANIDKAIAEKWIKVYCQAIVRAVNEKVCDEEALARWVDPAEGFLSPAEFIPELEESGLIYKLDLYVLEQVLVKIQLQMNNGMTIVPHSVNLSRSDFDSCDIVEEIRKRVDAAGVRRDLITIEITESVIGSDLEYMKRQVERFRELGFPVWMDDFGSGYSSLEVLQTVQFDLIKFDMSFMKKLNDGDRPRIVLTELVKLAASMGLDTVCEGVETQEQVRFLQEIGCSKLQGFYYSRPMPCEAILERYEKGLDVGFEDPESVPYYENIGRINLYDLDVITNREERVFRAAFNTIPMGIIEVKGNKARFLRSNPSYREFIRRFFGVDLLSAAQRYIVFNTPFMLSVVKKCADPGSRIFYDEKMPDGSVVHAFARRIGDNPATGESAFAIAVLSVSEPDQNESELVSSARKERDALARIMAITGDYLSLYSVDTETGRYLEFTASPDYETLGFEKEGEDFFLQGVVDGKKTVCAEDLPGYLRDFTKENVLRQIRENGHFTIHYRLMIQNVPIRVSLKIIPFQDGSSAKLLAGVRKWQIRN